MGKTVAVGMTGVTASWASFALSLTEMMKHAEAGLRVLTLLGGFVALCLTMYWGYRLNRVKVQREQDKLCDWCRAGHPPAHCPVPERDRPDDCLLRPRGKAAR